MKYKIGIIEYDFDQIMEEHIRKESREEAKNIIKNILKFNLKDLIFELIVYVERDMGNIICLHLTKMKEILLEKHSIKIEGNDFNPHWE